ncbi:sensor histidine kinase [Georgenia sp. SUBG003]|uniref:sensor histidine kinase n=1 Tax=Georgenia sp. SUBG003 TaxID=1497974 RepID=UPI0006943644
MRRGSSPWVHRDRSSLATRILVLQVLSVLLVVLGGWGFAAREAAESARTEAVARARATVLTMALDPSLVEAVEGPDPAAALAEPVEKLRATNDVDFLVVMSPEGVRYTHPDPAQVGRLFRGTIDGARAGRTTTEDYTGTLGRSVRVVTPVHGADGTVVALVSAGVQLDAISDRVHESLLELALLAAGALALGTVSAWLIARHVRRQTYGLGHLGLARLQSYHDALLHSVRAGLVLVSGDRRVVLCNDEARRLLGIPDVGPGDPVCDLPLDPALGELLGSGRECDGELHAAGGHTLVVTQVPARTGGVDLGWVTTLRDRTDLVRITGELDSLRGFSESLRARSHEADNRLHTVVALVELGEYDQAVAFATAALGNAQELVDSVTGAVTEPPLAALLLGKAAAGEERGVTLRLETGSLLPSTGIDPIDLVVVLGNLLDNAIDAAGDGEPPRWVRVRSTVADDELVLEVADSGPGMSPEVARQAFVRGWTTKEPCPDDDRPQGRGLGLALVASAVRRLGGSVVVERDVGARFVVRLPLPAGAAAGAPAGAGEKGEP